MSSFLITVLQAQAPATSQPSDQPPSTIQSIGGRTLLATVADARNRLIVDVGVDDFVINEDGNAREVLDVHVADYPVIILVDDGPDAARSVDAIRSAIGRFITRIGLRPVAVGRLSGANQIIATLEDERDDVLQKVAGLSVDPGAQPLPVPAIASAVQQVVDAGAPFSAIVVLTSRVIDTESTARADLFPAVLASGATIYVISAREGADGTGRDVPDLLKMMADQTHGQYTPIYSTASFAIALDRLADRLAAELMIDYLVPAGSVAGNVRAGVRIPGARVIGLGVK